MKHSALSLVFLYFTLNAIGQYRVTRFDETHGISPESIIGIWQDAQGYIWLADEKGFSRVNGDEVINFHEQGKLFDGSSNVIFKRDDIFYFTGGKFDKKSYVTTNDYSEQFQSFSLRTQFVIESDTLRNTAFTSGIRNSFFMPLADDDDNISLIINYDGDTLCLDSIYPEHSNLYTVDINAIVAKNPKWKSFSEINSKSFWMFYLKGFILSNRQLYLLYDKFVIEINEDLTTKKLDLSSIQGIVLITKEHTGDYLILSIDSPYLLKVSKEGKIKKEWDLLKDNLHWECQLLAGQNTSYFISTKEVYAIHDSPKLIGSFEEIMSCRIIENKLFLIAKIIDKTWFCALSENGIEKIFEIKSDLDTYFSIFKDNEQNYWANFHSGLYKISPAPDNKYYYKHYFFDPFQFKNTGARTYDLATKLKSGIINIGDYSMDSCQVKFITEDFVDSSNYPFRFNHIQTIGDSVLLCEEIVSGQKSRLISYNPCASEKVKVLDSAYVNGSNHYNFFDNFITRGNTIYQLDSIGLKIIQKFDSLKQVEILASDQGEFIIREWKQHYLFSRGELKFLTESNSIFEYAMLSENKITLLVEDTIKIYNKKGEQLKLDKVTAHFQTGQNAWQNRPIRISKSEFLYQGKFGHVIYYNDQLNILEKLSKVIRCKLPIVTDIFFDEKFQCLYLFSDRDIFKLSRVKNSNSGFSCRFLMSINSTEERLNDLTVSTIGNYTYFTNYNQYIYRYQNNFTPPIDSLDAFINSIDIISNDGTFFSLDSVTHGKQEYSSEQNNLAFHPEVITNYYPETVKYEYRLQGSNIENWQTTYSDSISFSNLDPGDYTFQFKAENGFNISSAQISYSFTILPPWYQTWWARTLYVLVGLTLIFFFMRWRTAALRTRQKQLEKTVEDRTHELQKEKELVEEKHKEITDSINYAERIQRSFLATKTLLDENLKEYFVLFQPKDVVSGDFYWATKLQNNHFALVTADSTGHGVPGAIMSILNITCLEKAVQEDKLVEPGEILNHARLNIIDRLKKDGSPEGGKDGMDASLVCFDLLNKKLNYAAANNPVWIVRQNEIIECDPDKMPVGKHDRQHIPFTSKQIDLQSGDVVYTLTDGLPDQFGGEKGKKFMYKRLKEFLISIASDPMEMQKEKLNKAFFDWKGDLEQVDDVCLIGVRV